MKSIMKFAPDIVDEKKIEAMRKIFSGYPQVQAAYLFGSQLTGKNLHQESDIDIGVFVDKYDFDLKLKIVTELCSLGNRIDLAMMSVHDIKDIVLAHEIIKHNRLIFKREKFNHPAFFSKINRMYFDFLPLLNTQFEYMKKRFAAYV